MWELSQGKELGLLGGTFLHDSYVNAIAMDQKTSRLYTGDGKGVIVAWKRSGNPLDPKGYSVLHRLKHPDLAGKPLASLMVHPRRRKGQLLALAHQNSLRLIDLYTYRSVNGGYPGVKSSISKMSAVISPDGRYVAAGSEDGKIRVWETQSAKPVLSGLEHVGFTEPLLGISWHPHEHVVALAAYGENMPVLLYWAEKASLKPHGEGEGGGGGGGGAEPKTGDILKANAYEEALHEAEMEKEKRRERIRAIKEKLVKTMGEDEAKEDKDEGKSGEKRFEK